jgi:mannose-6-phosphate isomerase-like protein (cupin superfamily)
MSTPKPFLVQEESCEVEGWDDPVMGKVVWRTLLSGDRTPSSRLTVGVAEIGPGHPEAYFPHRHEPPEVYYILSGEGVVTIDGEDFPLRAGSTVFIPANAWHGTRNTGAETLRLLYAFPVDSFSDVAYVFPDAPTTT